jgi:hypothetical protein
MHIHVSDRDAAEERFAWVDELEHDYIVPTVALIEGIDEDEVIRRLGGDPSASRTLTVQQAVELVGDDHREKGMIGVGTLNNIVHTIEGIGYVGAIPAVVRDLSRGGRCFSMLIDINGGDSIHYAVDGELVVSEEHGGPINPLHPNDPRWDPTWCHGLIDMEDPGDIWGTRIFALAERVMGTAVLRSWFTDPLRIVEVPTGSSYGTTDAWSLS